MPETSQRLRESCEKIRADAEAVSQAARQRDGERLLQRCGELTASVSNHVELVDARLSPGSQRRLLHDHRRLRQLARAIELAAADADAAGVQAAARRLHAFIEAHVSREAEVQ
ncbi:MAG TPA: hypothetical protein VHB97_27430 [Polyangia bacterium]|nr:hypothetical protein [Polyangia bacterium]